MLKASYETKTNKNFNPQSIDIDNSKTLSMKVFVATTSFLGVSVKRC